MAKISELPSFEGSEFIAMAVTVPPNGDIRNVKIIDHCYIEEADAIERIKEIYKNGQVPFILPVKL